MERKTNDRDDNEEIEMSSCYLCLTETKDLKRTEIRPRVWHFLCRLCRAIYED